MARNKRTNARKKADKSDPPQKQNRPYALVFYQAHKMVGVVVTEKLPADARVGSKVLSPDPIDMPASEQRFKATILEFGFSVDYLTNLLVSVDGTLLTGPPADDSVLAKRKSLHQAELAEQHKKVQTIDSMSKNLNKLDSIITPINPENNQLETETSSKYLNFSSDKTNDLDSITLESEVGTSTGTSSTGGDPPRNKIENIVVTPDIIPHPIEVKVIVINKKNDEQSDSTTLGSKNVRSETTITPPLIEVEENVENNKNDELFDTTSDRTNENQTTLCPLATCTNCPVVALLKHATPNDQVLLHSIAMRLLAGDIFCSIPHSPKGVLQEVNQNIGSNNNVIRQPALGVQQEASIINKEVLPNWRCFVDGEGKHRIVETLDVFLTKPEVMSIPLLVPRTHDVPKGKKKPPPELGNAVYPRGMVQYLLRALVPEEHLKTIESSKELPQIIFLVIKAYINYRLDSPYKLNDMVLGEFITDYTRNLRRDRTGKKPNDY